MKMTLLPLDWVRRPVMQGYILLPHCRVTRTPVCHLNRGNESSLNASVDNFSQQGFKTHLGFLEP